MPINLDDYELVEDEYEEVPEGERVLTSFAQLPADVRNYEQQRQVGRGMENTQDFTTALAGATGLFTTPEDAQRQAAERNRILSAGGEEIPASLKAATAIHSGLKKAAYLPWKVGESLNDITGLSRFLDVIGLPGPEGGYQSNTERALAYINDQEQAMSASDEAVHGQEIPYQLLEGTARGLAELPAQFLPAAGARTVAQGLRAASVGSGAIGGLTQFAQDRGQGRTTLEALPRAALSGIITGMTTKAFGATGAESILRGGVTGIKAKLMDALKQAGWEATEEAIDQMGQDILERHDNNPDKPLEATIKDVLMAGAIGGLIGGTVTGARGLLPSARQPRTDQEQDLSGIRLNQGAAQPSKAAEEFHQLQQMEKEGKLDVESAQRLEELKTISKSGMTIEDLDYLEQERQGLRLESTITTGSNPDDPFTGRVMQANFRTGKVEINPHELALQMKGMKPEERKAYIKSALSEEQIHLATPQETADSFIKNATGVEKFLAGWRYTGNVSGRPEAGADISERNLGHEMLRSQIQRMQGITRTELAASVKSGKLTTKILLASEDAIFDIRKALGTSASKEQLAALDKVQKNVKEGLRIASGAEGDEEGPSALRIAVNASPAVNDFAQKFMKGPEEGFSMNNNDTEVAGLGLKSTADLDALLSMRRSAVEERNKLKAEAQKLIGEGDQAAAMKAMNRMSAVGPKTQYIREAIEMATNLGSWQEGDRNKFGARPLDWQKNPEIAAWLRKNGKEVGVEIPEEAPAAIRRGGPSKRGQEAAEQRRRIVEMQARARGEELPPELATQKAEPAGAPVPAEDRAAPETWGFITPTPAQISQNANEVLGGEIKSTFKSKSEKRLASDIKRSEEAESKLPVQAGSTYYDRPSFQKFVDSFTGKGQRAIAPAKLREAWEDSVWSSVLNAPSDRLETLRKALGLEKNYGSSRVAESTIAPETDRPKYRGEKSAAEAGDATKDWRRSAATRMTEAVKRAEARRRYRLTLTRAIAVKLIEEANEGRPSLDRATVGVDDVAFDSDKSPYTEISRQDLADLKRLRAILRDGARGSSSDPETASHRLMAVVDGAGRVHLVSTYNDAGVQRAVSPTGTGMRHRPHEAVDAAFLKRYRPFASILLTDPIKGFKQTFKSVSEFNDQIGRETKERARIGDWEIVPEGPAAEDFQAEGTEGLEGEGGSFMGPGKQTVVPGARAGAMESNAPLTDTEMDGVLFHIMDESGSLDSPEDVKLSLDGLVAAAAADRLTPADRMAINGYRKVFDAIEAANPNLSREEVIDRMAGKIYENYQTSETTAEFVRKSLAEFAPQSARPAGPAAEAPRGRELTQMRDVAPTTVRGLQGPTLPAPAAQLGSETPVREAYIPDVQEEVRKTYDQDFPAGGDDEGPASLRRVGPTVSNLIRDTASFYDTWMVDRIEQHGGPVAAETAEAFRQIIDREKQLYGRLTPSLDKARELAGGTTRVPVVGQVPSPTGIRAMTWLNGLDPIKSAPFAATSRVVGAIEGTRRGIPLIANNIIQAARTANLEIGRMFESVAAGFRSDKDFLKNLRPFAEKVLKTGKGRVWDQWARELAADNGVSTREAKQALTELGAALSSPITNAEKEVAAEEFVRKLPSQVFDLDYRGRSFRMLRVFQAAGKFQRNITATGYDIVREGSGDMWNKWTAALARANGVKISEARKFFKAWKAKLDDPSSSATSIEAANQDFQRKYKTVVTHIKSDGRWQQVVHSDLFGYLENAARRATHARAFREVWPRTPLGRSNLASVMEDLRKELPGPYQKDLTAMMRTMQGHPTDDYSSMGVMGPTEVGGSTLRLFNQTIGNIMAKMALTGQLLIQPGEAIVGSTPVFLGYKNTLRGMAKVRQLYPEMERQGMVNRVIYDFSYDPKAPVRSGFKIAGNLLSKGFAEHALNEFQEATAAATARVVSDRIANNNLSDWEKRMLPETFKDMGFNSDEIMGMMQGDAKLLGQFQRKASAFMTSGNKAISEGSRLGASRLFNSVFRFQSYPMMKANQLRKVTGSLWGAWQEGTPFEKQQATRMFGRFMFGNTMQGALTAGITALAYQGALGLKLKLKEAEDEPLNFLTESYLSTISGPLYMAWRGYKSKGVLGVGENATRMAFPYTALREMYDMTQGAKGYQNLDTFGKIGKFLASKTPGTKAINTGLALFGLTSEDQKLDASMAAFKKWRREQQGFKTVEDFTKEDSEEGLLDEKLRKRFRIEMGKALESLRDGDSDKFYDHYVEAAGLLAERGKRPSALGEAFRDAKLLRSAKGAPLTPEQQDSLRARIGDEAYDRLEYYDLMLEQAAEGVLLPKFDE